MKLFISPHNDDEALFGTFTILREKPLVLIVTDSARQEKRGLGITAEQRRAETTAAMSILGASVFFLGIPDDELELIKLKNRLNTWMREHGPFERIYAPAWEPDGNVDHNLVASVEFADAATRYMTYSTAGKSVGLPVPFENEWIELKLRALACYRSQIKHSSTRDHFIRDQYEYYAA